MPSVSESMSDEIYTEPPSPKKTESTLPFLYTMVASIFTSAVFNPKGNKTEFGKINVTSTEANMNVSEMETSSEFSTETYETSEEFISTTISSMTENYETSEAPKCFVRKCEKLETATTTQGTTTTVDILEEHESQFDMETRRKLRRLCWETMFGQELVKLTVMDLVS